MFFWSSSGFASSWVWLFSSGFREAPTGHSILLSWIPPFRVYSLSSIASSRCIPPCYCLARQEKQLLSSVRRIRPAARLPPILSRLDRKNSFEHCPSPRPAGTTSTQFPQLAYVAAIWRLRREFRRGRSMQLNMKGFVSIVRSIRLLFAGTRYWVLEVLLADASDFAIASGPW